MLANISWKKLQLEVYHDFREFTKGEKVIVIVRNQGRQPHRFCDLKLFAM